MYWWTVSHWQDVDTSTDIDDNEILYRLTSVNADYQRKLEDFESLSEQQMKAAQELQNLFQALDSFKELVKVFEEQLQVHVRNQQANPQNLTK